MLTLAHDQCLVFHRMYYQSPLLPAVLEMYDDLIKNYIAPMFKDDVIVYQKKPTFRVHLPNNVAVRRGAGAGRALPPPRTSCHARHRSTFPPAPPSAHSSPLSPLAPAPLPTRGTHRCPRTSAATRRSRACTATPCSTTRPAR